MARFTFKAVDANNRTICGDLQAPTPSLAQMRLRESDVKLVGLWDEDGQSLMGRRLGLLQGLLLVAAVALVAWIWWRT